MLVGSIGFGDLVLVARVQRERLGSTVRGRDEA